MCGSNTSTCLPKSKQCDGIDDCLNSEDEASAFCCSDSEFGCYDDDGIYRCLDRDLNMCDGYSDCESGEDEENCKLVALPDSLPAALLTSSSFFGLLD